MTLIQCPECRKEVSSTVSKCPHCGYASKQFEGSKSGSGLVVAGYVLGVLSLFVFPPGLGAAAFIIGIVNLVKGRPGHGIAQIIISVTCGYLGMVIGSAVMSSRF